MDFDRSILDDFITEVKEHLETVEDDLLSLEKGKDDASFVDKVNRLFRAIHTVKGTAGFLGLKNMADVAHNGETLLSMLRSGELKPNSMIIDALLSAVDAIRSMLADVENSNQFDISTAMSKLKAVLSPTAGRAEEASTEKAASTSPADVPAPVPAAANAPTAAPPPPTPQAAPAGASAAYPVVDRRKPRESGEVAERRKEDARGDSIRVKINVINKLMQLAGELVLVRNQQLLSKDKSDPQLRNHVQRLNIVTSELQETIMATRMQPIGNLLGKFPRIVRDLGKKLEKQIELEISGNEVELDNTILESLSDPLTHLIRNCCDHGVESPADRVRAGKPEVGMVSIRAYHGNGQVNIEITDDGKGINPEFIKSKVLEKGLKSEAEVAGMTEAEIVNLILLPGFSTAEQLSDVSGRGVGMDVVKTSIEKLGGTLDIESHVGRGTVMRMRMPLTLAIIPCLIVEVGGQKFAIPQINVEELACLYDDEVRTSIEAAGSREVYRLRDQLLPMARLTEILKRGEKFTESVNAEITEFHKLEQEKIHLEHSEKNPASGDNGAPAPQSLNFVVLNVNSAKLGLIVDAIIGTEEIVVKPMHPALKSLYIFAGVTVMGDGQVALILDAHGITKHAGITEEDKKEVAQKHDVAGLDTQTVLLFKSGPDETFAISLPFLKRIETISLSQIERVGGKEYITLEGVSTLVIRLESHLKVSPCVVKEEMHLILPKHYKHPYGLLVSTLLDTTETSVELNAESYQQEGVLGTSIIRGKMTVFPDLDALVERAEPDWFSDDNAPSGEGRNRLLLVEDSQFFRRLVKKQLESKGFRVQTAENGQDGLSKLRGSDFDLIISDVQMPVMDGLNFMKQVRKEPHQSGVPAIALTAMNSETSRANASEAGFDRYVLKADRVGLLEAIADLMNPVASTAN